MGKLFSRLSGASSGDPMAARTFVDETIKGNRVVVFSKTYCPYCTKGKRALQTVLPKDKIHVIELENNPNCAAIQDYLLEKTGGRSVPRIFIDGEFIGGGDDAAELARNGQLKALVKKAGLI